MKGDPKVIDFLNKALPQRADRRQSILAALAHAPPLGLPGTRRETSRGRSIEEMHHADR